MLAWCIGNVEPGADKQNGQIIIASSLIVAPFLKIYLTDFTH